MENFLFLTCSILIFLILGGILYRLIRANKIAGEISAGVSDYKIKKESWNNLFCYFIIGLFLAIFGVSQWYILLNYLTARNFFIFNSGLCIIGFLAIYLIIKESPKAPLQLYCYVIFLIGLGYGIINFYFYFIGSNDFIIALGLGFPFIHILTLLLLAGYTIFNVLLLGYQMRYLEKIGNFESNKPHTGIILVHLSNPLLNFGITGIGTLVGGFRQYSELLKLKIPSKILGLHGKQPYTIYHCYSIEDINNIIKNDNVNKLWLFGHGIHHGINTDEGICFYCDSKDATSKELIAQMHCNDYGGTSLCEYLIRPFNEHKCIKNEGLRHAYFTNVRDVKIYLKNLE